MKITWRHLFAKKVTLHYPEEKWQLPPKSRMRLFMKYEDCIGCGQCARACPVQCIYIKADKRDRHGGADLRGQRAAASSSTSRVFDIDMSLCCYCNLCTYPCPTDCIYMTPEYEFATTDLTQHLYHFAKTNAKFLTVNPKRSRRAPQPRGARPRGAAPRHAARARGPAAAPPRRAPGAAAPRPEAARDRRGRRLLRASPSITVGSAAVVVLARSLIYSAFALLFTFFGVAGLYVLLGADFLAATQLLVYVGGILVLLLFGVMLTHKLYDLDLRSEVTQFLPGADRRRRAVRASLA